ncbi:MAG: hypothetical protein D6714_06330 [Bacteroidetes bacterium]|nr:MAG: hypothetical protein D6714_06330 [Bacteroidota bacterium]
MKTFLRILGHTFWVLLLTILTQVGGIVWLIAAALPPHPIIGRTVRFGILYLVTTFWIVPNVAPWFGREKIHHGQHVRPSNYLTDLFNRNYVVPEWNKILARAANRLADSGMRIYYLDANFPFWNGFPLLPHLSHNDGKKLDLSFIYTTPDGQLTHRQKSMTGYGVFESPRPGEINQTRICRKQGNRFYDYSKYITFGKINDNLIFSEKYTRQLLDAFLKEPAIRKVFIEPHLKKRLGLTDPRIRFQGCHSVRHDDHIHLQI